MQRTFLIHGFVEGASIFDPLQPYLPELELHPVELEEVFARWTDCPTDLNVLHLARHLRSRYQMSERDLVIGHSMGGWVAAYLRDLTGCGAIQIASYTDQRKVIFPVKNLFVLKWLARWGMLQMPGALKRQRDRYPFAESRELYDQLIDRMSTQDRRYLYQQLRVLFAAVPPLKRHPNLRIHARADNVVLVPDEAFDEVPGDHFTLFFHPRAVAGSIRRWQQTEVSA